MQYKLDEASKTFKMFNANSSHQVERSSIWPKEIYEKATASFFTQRLGLA